MPSAQTVTWCNFQGIRFTDPFFQQTVMRALGGQGGRDSLRTTPVDFLGTLKRHSPGIPPNGFIFHLSRCGSTLVSRMLASSPANIVLSEAPPFDDVLGQMTDGSGSVAGEEGQLACLRGLVSAWARPRNRESRLFMKLDSWHIRQLPLILRAFPGVPWIFLYRDPVEIMVSQRRMPGTQMIPGVFDPTRMGLDPTSVNPVESGLYMAKVLAQLCRAAIAYAGVGRGRLVNYRDLPDAVTREVAPHFGAAFTKEEMKSMADAAGFDAKSPWAVFSPDSSAKQGAATDDLRGLACTWLDGLYGELEAARALQR
jgi:hypothetical protein